MEFIFEPAPIVSAPITGCDLSFPVRRIYCVGRNYAAHAREMGFDPVREDPFFFCKPTDSLVVASARQSLQLQYPSETSNYHYEAELVVAIGKGGSNIETSDATDHILGYAVGLDMTRRDLQMEMREKGRPWEVGKSFDYSAIIGPIFLKESCPTVAEAGLVLKVNEEIKQDSNIANLIWSIPEIISYLSRYFHLNQGDLIYTGTPEGVGPVVSGDKIVVEIDGLENITVDIV